MSPPSDNVAMRAEMQVGGRGSHALEIPQLGLLKYKVLK